MLPQLNLFDIIIILLYLFFLINGFNKGFFSSIVSLLIIVSSFFISIKSFILIESFYIFQIEIKIMILVVLLFIFILAGLYLKKFIMAAIEKITIFSALDKLLGLIFGFLKATFILFGISYILMFYTNSFLLKNSKIFPYVENYIRSLSEFFI